MALTEMKLGVSYRKRMKSFICNEIHCFLQYIGKMDKIYDQSDSENKGNDQLCSYCTADLCLCFRIGKNQFFLIKKIIVLKM